MKPLTKLRLRTFWAEWSLPALAGLASALTIATLVATLIQST